MGFLHAFWNVGICNSSSWPTAALYQPVLCKCKLRDKLRGTRMDIITQLLNMVDCTEGEHLDLSKGLEKDSNGLEIISQFLIVSPVTKEHVQNQSRVFRWDPITMAKWDIYLETAVCNPFLLWLPGACLWNQDHQIVSRNWTRGQYQAHSYKIRKHFCQ